MNLCKLYLRIFFRKLDLSKLPELKEEKFRVIEYPYESPRFHSPYNMDLAVPRQKTLQESIYYRYNYNST